MTNGHPSEEQLLRCLDGELDHGDLEAVRGHLDACWTCRMRSAGIQEAIVEYARERERVSIPQPPSPWKNLNAEFQSIHRSAAPPSLLKRLRGGVLSRINRFTLTCGVATAMAAAGWMISRPI